jgi:hypothetical protein
MTSARKGKRRGGRRRRTRRRRRRRRRRRNVPSCLSSVYLHFPFKSHIRTTPSTVPVPSKFPVLFQSIVVTSFPSLPMNENYFKRKINIGIRPSFICFKTMELFIASSDDFFPQEPKR